MEFDLFEWESEWSLAMHKVKVLRKAREQARREVDHAVKWE